MKDRGNTLGPPMGGGGQGRGAGTLGPFLWGVGGRAGGGYPRTLSLGGGGVH